MNLGFTHAIGVHKSRLAEAVAALVSGTQVMDFVVLASAEVPEPELNSAPFVASDYVAVLVHHSGADLLAAHGALDGYVHPRY
jgi:xanthine/CO dehydrogenase XdhC/CoxF family maturation factor